MNKMQTLAKIALVTLALFIILQIAKSVVYSLPLVCMSGEERTFSLISLIAIAVLIILAIVIGQQLLVKADMWASRIVMSSETNQSQGDANWLPTTYRILCIVAGVLFLYWTVPSFFVMLTAFLMKMTLEQTSELQMAVAASFWPRFVSFAIRLTMAAYLLCGAPHFVRWQVRKTLEQCAQPPRIGKENTQDTAQES
jgi:hypothetical protein